MQIYLVKIPNVRYFLDSIERAKEAKQTILEATGQTAVISEIKLGRKKRR